MPHFTFAFLRSRRSRRHDASSPPSVEGYQLIRVLGTGRHSLIYLAAPENSPRPDLDRVVVRIYEGDDAAAESAQQTARLWQELGSAQCPQYLDQPPVQTGARAGRPALAIVSSWASAGSLAELLERRHGNVRMGEAVTMLAPLAQLVAALHQRGIGHGSLSADNVHFDETGCPILLGWGARSGGALSDDVLRFGELCRVVLDACMVSEPQFERFLVDELSQFDAAVARTEDVGLGATPAKRERLGETLAEPERQGATSADREGPSAAGADREARFAAESDLALETFARFWAAAEDALFSLAEPCAIAPLQPFDWAAEATTVLAGVDAEVDTLVAQSQRAERPAARLQAGAQVCLEHLRAAFRRVARERTIRLWPRARHALPLKTVALGVVVGSVALTGALLATPVSTQSATPGGSLFTTSATPGGSLSTTSAAPGGSLSSTSAAPGASLSTTSATPGGSLSTTSATPGGSLSTPSAAPGASTAATTAPGESHTAHAPEDAGTETSAETSAVAGEDGQAAVAVLIRRREECFVEKSVDCFDGVDQPDSAASAADLGALTELQSSGSQVWPKITSAIGATASVQVERVGDAVLVPVTQISAAGATAGVEAQTTKPASALLVKGEAGWRIRQIFVPPG